MPNNSTGKPHPQCPVSDEALVGPIHSFWPLGNIPFSVSELYPTWFGWLFSPVDNIRNLFYGPESGNYSIAEPEIQADFRDATNYIEELLDSRLTFTESFEPLSGPGIVLNRCNDFNREVGGFTNQRLGLDGLLYQVHVCLEDAHSYTNHTIAAIYHELLHALGITDVSQLEASSAPYYPDFVKPLQDSRNGAMCSVLPYGQEFVGSVGQCQENLEDGVFSCQPNYLTEYGIVDDRLLKLAYVDRQHQDVFVNENITLRRLTSSFFNPYLLGFMLAFTRGTIKSSIAPEQKAEEYIEDTRQQKFARIIADVSVMVLLLTSGHTSYTSITHMALSLFSLLPEQTLDKLPDILPKAFRSPYYVSNFLTLFSLGIRTSAIAEAPLLSLLSILSGVVTNGAGSHAGKSLGNLLGGAINYLATKGSAFFQQHYYSSGSQDSSSLLADEDESEARSYGSMQIQEV
jgi:hypothetical protein